MTRILPRKAGLAYAIFAQAQRFGMFLWTDGRVIVQSERRPTPAFRRMGAVDRNNGEAA